MCCLAFEHEGYAGQKKCPIAAQVNGNDAADISDTLLPEDKQTIDLEKIDEEDDFQ
jgi:hypothetical protein